MSETWVGVGGCSAPFTTYTYPTSFQLLDRREAEYGFIDPYALALVKPGNHLGGIGSSCGTGGQTWFLQGYDSVPTSMSQPLIVTEFPSNQPIGSKGDLEELSFYIDQMYMQCHTGTSPCSLWQNAYLNAMSKYPFAAPRQALHFIQASRATAAWTMSNMTYNGLSAYQMLQNTITGVWSTAVGPDGGLYQNFGVGGSDKTPEPNFQALIAFDPRMPSWFDQPADFSPATSATSQSTTTAHSSTSTMITTTLTQSSTSGLIGTVSLSNSVVVNMGNSQTVTVLDSSGHPIAGAKITLYQNSGKGGGYAHGITSQNGQFKVQTRYPTAGTYAEWAVATYGNQSMASAKTLVVVTNLGSGRSLTVN